MSEFLRTWLLPEVLSTLGFVMALLFVASLLKPHRSPASATAWLLIIFLMPYVGVPLYLMFGGRKLSRMASRKPRVYHHRHHHEIDACEEAMGRGVERILGSHGLPPKMAGNRMRLVGTGEQAYHETIELIKLAQCEVHLLFYILGNDEVGRSIVATLAEKAQAGVRVRLMLDALGSWALPRSVLTPLTQAGGEVSYFMPMIHLPFRGRANLRNHRKILVVDERVAMMGGINLAQEYMGPTPDPKRWLDLSVVIEGPVVGPISTLFRDDWNFAAKQQTGPCPKIDPGLSYLGETDVPTAAQLVASGPDVEGDPFYETVLAAIYGAARRVWVVTPYFVPDQSIAQALELASRRGIDVRLIVPEHSNHLMADIARNSYLKQVAASGAKVLLYERGMVHAKTIVIDDDLAIVGSANIDMRSLFLNYEAALFLSSMESVTEVADWIQALFVDCKHSVPKQGPVRELAEGVVRLIAPLL